MPDKFELREDINEVGSPNEEVEERSVKRKRGNGLAAIEIQPTSGSNRICNILDKVQAKVHIIADMAKERNTKKEIKDAASSLNSLMKPLYANDVQKTLMSLGKDGKIGEQGDMATLLLKENEDLKKRINRLENEMEVLRKDRNVGGRSTINQELLQKAESYQDIIKLSTEKWPEDFYEATSIKIGSPLQEGRYTDIVLLEEQETEDNPK